MRSDPLLLKDDWVNNKPIWMSNERRVKRNGKISVSMNIHPLFIVNSISLISKFRYGHTMPIPLIINQLLEFLLYCSLSLKFCLHNPITSLHLLTVIIILSSSLFPYHSLISFLSCHLNCVTSVPSPESNVRSQAPRGAYHDVEGLYYIFSS